MQRRIYITPPLALFQHLPLRFHRKRLADGLGSLPSRASCGVQGETAKVLTEHTL